jgi:hypothetical protein
MDHSAMNLTTHFLIFLSFVGAMFYTRPSHASYVATPTFDGYAAGTYKPISAPTISGGGFSGAGRLTVAGRAVSIPGAIEPAANAASYARGSLLANPWLAGVALLAWTGDAGLHSDQVGGWNITNAPSTVQPGTQTVSCYTMFYQSPNYTCATSGGSDALSTCNRAGGSYNAGINKCTLPDIASCSKVYPNCTGASYGNPAPTGNVTETGCPAGYTANGSACALTDPASAATTTHPATQADFDALPAPSVGTLGDLAFQLGIPAAAPVYEPARVPTGDPYTKPDGSTAQPMAVISPASNGQVTVSTYDQPLTDTAGQPVTNPAPEPTPDPPPEPTPGQCDKYPATLGCANLDTPTAEDLSTQARNISMITPVAVGGAGVCPAPMTASFLGQNVSMSFDPLCQFANALRPLVLVLAWLSAGYIFIGGVKT